jgi:hypothetical protein
VNYTKRECVCKGGRKCPWGPPLDIMPGTLKSVVTFAKNKGPVGKTDPCCGRSLGPWQIGSSILPFHSRDARTPFIFCPPLRDVTPASSHREGLGVKAHMHNVPMELFHMGSEVFVSTGFFRQFIPTSRQTICTWVKRGRIPAPDLILPSGRRYWRRDRALAIIEAILAGQGEVIR